MAGLSQDNLFRDVYSPAAVRGLHDRLVRVAETNAFRGPRFLEVALSSLESKRMSERVAQIADALEASLPDDFRHAVQLLIAATEDVQPEPGKTDWTGFIVIPQCEFVARRGIDDFETSMGALYAFTKRFTAENHLRVFVEHHFDDAMARLYEWTSDPDPHVRRLVSEGTRPRLPMTGRIQRFIADPAPAIALLDRLYDDPSLYVRRSVANHINDVAKDNPDAALDTLERWAAACDTPSSNRDARVRWVIRHASRTLLKAGHPRALALQGYTPSPQLRVELVIDDSDARVGGELRFRASITSTAAHDQRVLVDYVIGFVKANGAQKDKVFKGGERTLAPGETWVMERRQHLRPTSGRRVYPGRHALALQISGVRGDAHAFDVL